MASDAAVKALIEGLYGVALVTQVSAAALWAYDYFLTLGMEIELVWTTKWNIIKVLFLVQRYLPLIDTCILTLYRDLMPQTERNCSRLETTTGFMYVTGYAIAEILLSLRVWAVWNRSKALAFLLPIAFIVIWSPAFIFMYYFTLSLKFSPAPPYPGARGCFIIFAKDYVKWCWTSLIIWNTLTLSLMLIPGVRLYQSRLKSSLTMVVYRDGTFYFVYLFVLSLLNIILSVVLTVSFATANPRCFALHICYLSPTKNLFLVRTYSFTYL
ncbi:hypothetical protein GALMADRAFT_226328 [Galerina marginata CBS 339.88]|uniref:DUF6533 domain-containing protein n=1 Tax=Galerina marginata (strain CBS 339.88) TaxID=685588 RepID=A0A067T9K6_GALM3|nr:hypothetical protein GALMADRAFT_226328 [Galerina marginata CBS 339.88]